MRSDAQETNVYLMPSDATVMPSALQPRPRFVRESEQCGIIPPLYVYSAAAYFQDDVCSASTTNGLKIEPQWL
jgi:hypothetical protein